ncbi:hypothetical protein DFH05DRAFT_1539706 [Lentinula detonsa]|uniref:Rho-GAP domain-containing protein n=1 Tax=Lentinula detonsa TaxID=2804962 RepID=A0A9W8U152_9AGAR|nr:hypothetical protein DFH05DRAFT_1539706 [Lentinula detonsa]
MVFSRPFIQNNDNNRSSSPYTKLPTPTRFRRSSAFDSRHLKDLESSSNKYLQPKLVEHARNRSVSLTESAIKKILPSHSTNGTQRPTSLSTPSRLPRPSVNSTPRSHHGHSASLDSFQEPMTTSRLKTPMKHVGHSATARRAPAASASAPLVTKPKPQPSQRIEIPPLFIPSSTSQPVLTTPEPEPRHFSKRDPKQILHDLKLLIGAGEAGNILEFLPLDVMSAIHERELMEGAARFQRAKSTKKKTVACDVDVLSSEPLGVFGFPLRQIALYASTKAVLGGFEHNLPIVVFACVEELYRSGISTPSNPTPTSPSPIKFTQRTHTSSPPDFTKPAQPRFQALFAIFDSSSHKFGLHASLKDEASDDVYELLTTFLSRLPEPVLAPLEFLQGLRDAFWTWCVKPPGGGPTSQFGTRIRIAQMLLGLLPTPNLSLLVYLMAFSCQVLEVRMKMRRKASAARDLLICGAEEMSALEAQMLALERELEGKNEREKEKQKLGRAWGVWLFGEDQGGPESSEAEDSRSTQIMSWLLTNWGNIIRGFFEHGISVDADLPAPNNAFGPRVNLNLVQALGLATTTGPNSEGGQGGVGAETGDIRTAARDVSPRFQHMGEQQKSMPMEESHFASSMSRDRLRDSSSIISLNTTPRQPLPPHASLNKIGLVRGQYGKPNSETLVPAGAEKEGSMHSRYSPYSTDGGTSKLGDNKLVNEHESVMMEQEVSQSSVSALDERLLDLRFSESEVNQAQFYFRNDRSPPREEGMYDPRPLVHAVASDSGSDSSPPLGPLRVINRGDSEYSLRSSIGAESGSSASSRRAMPVLTFSSRSASESEHEGLSDPNLALVCDYHLTYIDGEDGNNNKTVKERWCTRCADDCMAHLYAKELEMRVAALTKENGVILSLDGIIATLAQANTQSILHVQLCLDSLIAIFKLNTSPPTHVTLSLNEELQNPKSKVEGFIVAIRPITIPRLK